MQFEDSMVRNRQVDNTVKTYILSSRICKIGANILLQNGIQMHHGYIYRGAALGDLSFTKIPTSVPKILTTATMVDKTVRMVFFFL
jgi:hypothetical protein